MKKVRIAIVETHNQLRAIIQIGYNLQPPPGKRIIFQRIEEIKDGENLAKVKKATAKLKERAKQWARENKIPYITNLDPPPRYP